MILKDEQKLVKFYNGVEYPPIIMATNWMDYPTLKRVVSEGLKIGFRAFDTARDYGNEHIVGRVLRECLKEQNIDRSEIFITTKIGNSQQRLGNIEEQIEISLKNLQTDYVDCWLMHWPYPGFYVDTYRKMEKVYKSGKVHAIGMANCNVRYFEEFFREGIDVVPHCVQFEHHPLRIAQDIQDICNQHNIAIQAYAPLCRMIPKIKESPVLNEIANRLKKTIGQVILRWHYQHHTIPCVKSTKPERLLENFNIWDFQLSDEEVLKINSMDEDYKYHLESASCPGY